VGEYALLEIEHMVRAGMTELEAIVAATQTCAALCGVEDDVGTVEAGKIADLIVTAEDPLQDISNLRRLTLVLKEGVVVNTDTSEGVEDFWELFYF
jgi:imidazolonepropionase-like amidohydrolase